MAKVFKNSKTVLSVALALAVLAVSLFTGIVINTEAACVPSGSKTVYWNGRTDSDLADGDSNQTGADADHAIIIDSAEELAYLATSTYADTNGKYFKVADDIGKIVLQNQTMGAAILDLDSATAVKDYFESTLANNKAAFNRWASRGWSPTRLCFSGNFDGNGVEIYGMYNTTGDANDNYSGETNSGGGLFSVADGATISNLTIKNSYTNLGEGTNTFRDWSFGLIVSFGADADNGSDFNLINNCTVANNYVYKKIGSGALARAGLVVGAGNADKANQSNAFVLQNILVYGNIAKGCIIDTDEEYNLGVTGGQMSGAPFVCDAYKAAYPDWVVDNTYMATGLADSIILGTPLLPTNNAGTIIKQGQWTVLNAMNSGNNNIKNVYTDWDVNKITDHNNFKKDFFLANCGNVISASDATGAAAANLELDWSVWIASVDGYPELRAAHGEIKLTQTSTEHYYACVDCGYRFLYGEQVAHEWDNDTCTVCEYSCHHNEEGFYVPDEHRPATCISREAMVSYCNNCDWNQTDEFGSAPTGHALEWVEEIPAGCHANGVEAEGRKGFWHCTECGGMFIEETEAEAMWSANSIGNYLVGEEIPVIDSLIIPLGNHSAVNRADGSIMIKPEGAEGHYWICYSCDGKLEAVESEEVAEEGTLTKHNFSKSICIDCGWKCTEHDYKATGVVAVAGTCYVDHEEEYKCTICGDIQNVVTQPAGHKVVKIDEVPATDRLEGMKEHYECSVCHEIYVDAEGKTKATTAELIIAKTLPAGYENVQIGNLNTDNSGKSPATGDNLAAVIAVAALAGVALVATRKIRK